MAKPSGLRGWGVDDRNVAAARAAGSGKLVRDRIPEIIRGRGGLARTRVAKGAEYRRRLAQKLVEESAEYMASPNTEELADVLEVVRALCPAHRTTYAGLERVRKAKARERGSFRKGIILDA
jgi:predicted house-cleaning noncanonical NTP pyrophosphatase (MazG superfamily)